MTLILLVGKKGSGKDTIADYLVTKNWIKLSFGDCLKNALKILFDFSDDQLWGNKKEKIDDQWEITPRYLLQTLGTDFLRDFLGDKINLEITVNTKKYKCSYHIKRLHQQVIKLLDQGKNVVIADTRFQDEINWGKLLNGKIIKINRPIKKDNKFSNHKSENIKILKYIDFEITNNMSKKVLYQKIKKLLFDNYKL